MIDSLQTAFALALLSGLLDGCYACGLDTGCEPAMCAVPDWLATPGTYLTDSAEIHLDECNTGLQASDLSGVTLHFIEQQPPMPDMDGNPQVIAIDGDWRFKFENIAVRCGVGSGSFDSTAASLNGCTWTSHREGPLQAEDKDVWRFSPIDDRSNPAGPCWTGPASCQFAYSLRMRRMGP